MAATQVDVLLAGIRDTSGEPLAAGKVYTYEAGTTTDKTTWTDIDKTTTAANPIILDANGRALRYAEGNYKFVVKDSDDNTIYTWDDLTYKLLDSDSYYSGNSTGSSNAYVLSNSIPISALVAGQTFEFIPNFTNTSAATINIDSLGPKAAKLRGGVSLIGGEIAQNRVIKVFYDGTDLILTSFEPAWTDWTPIIGASGSATISGSTVSYAKFKHYEDHTKIKIRVASITVATAAADYLTFTLPKNAVAEEYFGCYTFKSSTEVGIMYTAAASSSVRVYYDGALTAGAWTTGTSRAFIGFTIEYRT